ncbi:MAG: hypothetical protein ABIZ30_09965, partial [Candidatus Limnocylindrales bacterium]
MRRLPGTRRGERDDGEMPIYDAFDPDLDRHDPGLPFGRRKPGPPRGAWIAIGALAVLVAGIALGGASTTPDPSASPGNSGLTAVESADAEIVDASCSELEAGQFPNLSLVIPGTSRFVEGLLGVSYELRDPTP